MVYKKGLEKRFYWRVPVRLTVRYSRSDYPNKILKDAISSNFSQGGIFIQAQELLPVGTTIIMQINVIQLPRPIEATGRITWVEEVQEGTSYNFGVVFTEISDNANDFIKQYILTVDLNMILSAAANNNASDVHLTADRPPVMRVYGDLVNVHDRALSADEVRGIIYGFLNDSQKEKFENDLELDISYVNDIGRFRVNIHQEKGNLGAAFRFITSDIKSVRELGLPKALEILAHKTNGLILITGPTGSGKSTTLAAIIDLINKQRKCMIVSLEDPIEYLHKSEKSIIKQREIGFDSRSFVEGLKHTLRQDVDVILVGEIRDIESIAIALTAAETGHLVLTTLHTADTVSAINRILDVFPAKQQSQVRIQLAEALRGVVGQILLPKKNKDGLVVATEVLMESSAVSNLIRQGNTEQLRSVIQTGGHFGMHTLDSSLLHLYKEGLISIEDAMIYSKDPSAFSKKTQSDESVPGLEA